MSDSIMGGAGALPVVLVVIGATALVTCMWTVIEDWRCGVMIKGVFRFVATCVTVLWWRLTRRNTQVCQSCGRRFASRDRPTVTIPAFAQVFCPKCRRWWKHGVTKGKP